MWHCYNAVEVCCVKVGADGRAGHAGMRLPSCADSTSRLSDWQAGCLPACGAVTHRASSLRLASSISLCSLCSSGWLQGRQQSRSQSHYQSVVLGTCCRQKGMPHPPRRPSAHTTPPPTTAASPGCGLPACSPTQTTSACAPPASRIQGSTSPPPEAVCGAGQAVEDLHVGQQALHEVAACRGQAGGREPSRGGRVAGTRLPGRGQAGGVGG